MTATYTFDVFSSLDGYGAASANWTGYWGKQGPELLDHRLALYGAEQRMVFGANTYRAFARMLASSTEESEVRDPWVTRMRSMPATVVSTTLEGPLDWPDATVVSGDAVDVVARLKEESEVPLRSHGSLSIEPGADGRRPGRPRAGDALPCHHRSDRAGPDLPGCGRLRPGAGRKPDARRSHPRAHLPTHPPLNGPRPTKSSRSYAIAAGADPSSADGQCRRASGVDLARPARLIKPSSGTGAAGGVVGRGRAADQQGAALHPQVQGDVPQGARRVARARGRPLLAGEAHGGRHAIRGR